MAAVMRGGMLRRLEQETEKSPGTHISLALSNKLKKVVYLGEGKDAGERFSLWHRYAESGER